MPRTQPALPAQIKRRADRHQHVRKQPAVRRDRTEIAIRIEQRGAACGEHQRSGQRQRRDQRHRDVRRRIPLVRVARRRMQHALPPERIDDPRRRIDRREERREETQRHARVDQHADPAGPEPMREHRERAIDLIERRRLPVERAHHPVRADHEQDRRPDDADQHRARNRTERVTRFRAEHGRTLEPGEAEEREHHPELQLRRLHTFQRQLRAIDRMPAERDRPDHDDGDQQQRREFDEQREARGQPDVAKRDVPCGERGDDRGEHRAERRRAAEQPGLAAQHQKRVDRPLQDARGGHRIGDQQRPPADRAPDARCRPTRMRIAPPATPNRARTPRCSTTRTAARRSRTGRPARCRCRPSRRRRGSARRSRPTRRRGRSTARSARAGSDSCAAAAGGTVWCAGNACAVLAG